MIEQIMKGDGILFPSTAPFRAGGNTMDGGAQKNAPRRSRDVHSPAKGYDEAEKQAQSGSGRLQSSRGVSGSSSQGSITVTDSWGISPHSMCAFIREAHAEELSIFNCLRALPNNMNYVVNAYAAQKVRTFYLL